MPDKPELRSERAKARAKKRRIQRMAILIFVLLIIAVVVFVFISPSLDLGVFSLAVAFVVDTVGALLGAINPLSLG